MNDSRRSNRGGLTVREATERANLAFWLVAVLVGVGSLFTGLREFGSTLWVVVGAGLGAWLLGGLAGFAAMCVTVRVSSSRLVPRRDDAYGVDLTDLIVPWIIVGILSIIALMAIFRRHSG